MEDIELPMDDFVLTIPVMDVKRDGDDKVSISAPVLKIVLADDADQGDGVIAGTTVKNAVVHFERGNERFVVTGALQTLDANSSGTEDDPFTLAFGMEGLTFAMNAKGYEPFIASIEAGDNDSKQAMRTIDLKLDYAYEGMTLTLDAPSTASSSRPPMTMEASSGQSDSSIALGQGRLEMESRTKDTAFAVTSPMPVTGAFGLLSYSVGMPTEASTDPQPMHVAFDARDINFSEQLWAMADPGKVFPRALNQIGTDLSMQVILKESMFDDDARAARKMMGGRALDPVEVSLKSLVFDGLGLDVSGEGDMAFDGQIPTSMGAFLSVKGLSDFMANAIMSGLLPEPQAMMVEGMAQQFGKETDDGALVFEVKTSDSMVLINDKPVAPLPK